MIILLRETATGSITRPDQLGYELTIDTGISAQASIKFGFNVEGVLDPTKDQVRMLFASAPNEATVDATIAAHDDASDYVVPEGARGVFSSKVPTYPFVGAFDSVGDLPSPTFSGAIAVVGNASYTRESGAWVLGADSTVATLSDQIETAQAGGNASQSVPSYSRLVRCSWSRNVLRATNDEGAQAWHYYAYCGKLTTSGDRIDWPGWLALQDGGSLAVVLLSPDTVPAPASSSTLLGAWGAQWAGGFSLVKDAHRWKVKGSGINGSGWPANGLEIEDGHQFSLVVRSDDKLSAQARGNTSTSDFTVPPGGFDVWVVFEGSAQRLPAALATSTASAPVPGTPDGGGVTTYVPTHAVAFDGINDYVLVPADVVHDDVLRWDRSWAVGLRAPVGDEFDTDYFQNMLTRGAFNGFGVTRTQPSKLRLHVHAQGTLTYGTYNIPGSLDLSGTSLSVEYNHTSDELKLYVNGELEITLTVPTVVASASVLSADTWIGCGRTGNSTYNGWEGYLHEVFFVDRILTSPEHDEYVSDPNLANATFFADIVGWWPLGTGDTYPALRNLIVGSPDATLINATASTIQEIS